MTDPGRDTARRKEMLETNQAQRAYYDQTDGEPRARPLVGYL